MKTCLSFQIVISPTPLQLDKHILSLLFTLNSKTKILKNSFSFFLPYFEKLTQNCLIYLNTFFFLLSISFAQIKNKPNLNWFHKFPLGLLYVLDLKPSKIRDYHEISLCVQPWELQYGLCNLLNKLF